MMSTSSPLEAIFFAALKKASPAERAAYLDEACAGDNDLRERVERMLAAQAKAGSFLEIPASEIDRTIDEPIAEAPGTVIGPYKLLQQIGEGGMGVVYMAEQTEPVERRVALKIIKPGMDTRQVIARFEAERHALALMDHPNIARVLDAGTTQEGAGGRGLGAGTQGLGAADKGRAAAEGHQRASSPAPSPQPPVPPSLAPDPCPLTPVGRPYFVMELVKGVPITQYCDEHHLTPQERLELFVPVCHAVQHAHQKGIIHRDIKPTNVLVAEYDDRPVPKIIDFGVAKAIQQRLTERTVFTQLGQVVGTIDYMSPEQAKLNELDVDTRSDVYALGVLLYELLTGETPFDRERLRAAAFDELLRIIREEEPPKPSHRLSSSQSLPSIAANRQIEPKKLSTLVRGELDWIVMKALEKDRSRRYETANGLANDIQRYLHDEPVVACPPSAAYRLRKFARRNKGLLAATGIIGVILLVASLVSTWQAVRATQAFRSEMDARQEAEDARAVAEQERATARKRADEATAARGEAERAAAEAQAVADFLVNDLLGSAKPEETLGREVTVKEVLANAEKTIDTAFKDQPLREAAVRHTMAEVYRALGQYEAAERHARRAAELRAALLGPEHPDMLLSMSNLARVLHGQGKPEEAHRIHEETLGIQKRVLGPEHPSTLRSMNSVANGLHLQGKLDEARELFNETLALRKRVLGPEHRDTLNTMHDLAHVEKPQQAAKLHEELLAIQKRVLGPEHPDTLRSMYCLAGDLVKQERLEEGQKLLEETVAIQKRVLGPEHPDTLRSMHNIAWTFGLEGKHDEARRMFEETLAIRNRVLGPEHPITLTSMAGLATALRFLGKFDEARKLHEETLAIRKRVLGAEHPDTLGSMKGLATVLQDLGKFDEALKLHEEVLAIEKRAKPWRPDPCLIQNLVFDLCQLGKPEEACKLAEETLAIQKRVLGPEHADTLRSMRNLASVLRELGKSAEARKLDEETLAIRKRVSGAEDPETLSLMNNKAVALLNRGKLDEARKLLEETYAIQNRVLGPDHADTLVSMSNLALVLRKLGKSEEARKLYQETLAKQKRVLGLDHPDTLATMNLLALALKDLVKLDEAHRLWQEFLRDLRQVAMDKPQDQPLQKRVASCEREICQRYGAMGLWELAATAARHNAALKRVTDYQGDRATYRFDTDHAIWLAAAGEEQAWREYCQLIARRLAERSPPQPPTLWLIRTSCFLEPPALDPELLSAEESKLLGSGKKRSRFGEACVALAQYRASRYDEAWNTFTRSPLDGSCEADSWSPFMLWAGYAYALAAQGKARSEDALAQLQRADSVYESICRATLGAGGKELVGEFAVNPWDLAAAQILRREAWKEIKDQSPPADPWWHLIQARGYGLLGERELSEREFTAAVATARDDPEVWATRARVFELLGETGRAEADRKKATELVADKQSGGNKQPNAQRPSVSQDEG